MEIVFLLARLVPIERYREIIAQRIHHNHHSLVKALGVPAAILRVARRETILELDGRNGALGAVFEDETRQEEAGAKEVDTERMEDAGAMVSLGSP